MLNSKAGRKLDPVEVEEYYRWKFERSHKQLLNDASYEGVPSFAALTQTIREYHYFKKDCLTSFLYCGIAYNKQAFTGADGECGKTDHFGIWKKNINEKKAKNYIKKLMEHYEFPLFHTPRGMDYDLNTFYQAKYGMFTCHDLNHCIGQARYDADLVNYWNKLLRDKKDTWYLAIAYSASNGKIKLHDLQDYKKNYRESPQYQQYLSRNPHHHEDLQDMINQIQGGDYYEQLAKDRAAAQLTESSQALFKRVKFYKTKGKEQNYIIPNEIKKLIEYDSDEELQARIHKIQSERYE